MGKTHHAVKAVVLDGWVRAELSDKTISSSAICMSWSLEGVWLLLTLTGD